MPVAPLRDMTCNQITDDMLDEVILGRSSDFELCEHLSLCSPCRERFSEYEESIALLRQALREIETG